MKIYLIFFILFVLPFPFVKSSIDCPNNAKKIPKPKEKQGSRHKRNNEGKNSKSDIGETKQEPGLGRTIQLGSLYYGNEDRISLDESLWSDKTLKKKATIVLKPSSKTQLSLTQSKTAKARIFGMGLRLKVSVFFGITVIDESAKMLKQSRSNLNSVSITFSYEAINRVESISQDLRSRLDHPEICLDLIGKENGPTHVISSITRGFQGMFEFQKETSNSSANAQEASGMMEHLAKMEKSTKDKEKSNIPKSDVKGDGEPKGVTVNFFGDQIFTSPPKTIKAAFKALKDFPKKAKNSSKVIYYTMTPISRYCDSDLAVIVRDMEEKQTEELTEIPDQIEESKLEVKAMLQRSASGKFTRTIGKTLLDYLEQLKMFETSWTQNATLLIQQFRKGKVNGSSIVKHLSRYQNSPYSPIAVQWFLKNRKRELETVESMIHDKTKGIIVYEEDSGNDNNCMFKKRLTVEYKLEILPKKHITKAFIANLKKCQNERFFNRSQKSRYIPCLEEYDNMEKNYWFWNNSLIAKAGEKLRGFMQLFHTTENKKDTCFIIKILRQRNMSNPAAIVLYRNGKAITDNFHPPTKVENPHNVTVSLYNINLTARYSKSKFELLDQITNTIRLQYVKVIKNQTENEKKSNTQVRQFPMKANTVDISMILDDLSRDSIYKIKMWAGSEFGYGPASDDITVVTNKFSEPRNFTEINKTYNSISLAWERPKNPTSINLTELEYHIMIYTERNHDKFNFPMLIPVDGDKTEQTIDDLPSIENFYVTIELVNNTPSGGVSYPLTVRKDHAAALNITTLPTTPNPPIIERVANNEIFILFLTPPSLKPYVNYYFLTFVREIDGERMQPSFVNTTKEYLILTGLEQNSVYQLRVLLDTTFGKSNSSEEVTAETLWSNASYHLFLREELDLPELEEDMKGDLTTKNCKYCSKVESFSSKLNQLTRKVDKENKGKDEFNKCMDKKDPKKCSSIDGLEKGNSEDESDDDLSGRYHKESLEIDFFGQSRAMESIWCINCDENCENKEECDRPWF